jgi:hypothetical protein
MRFDKDKFVKTYLLKRFNISKTCTACGVSRKQFYRWKEKDADFAARLIEVREALVDEIEDQLVKNAKAGNQKAVEFFLEAQARDRGYGKKIEIDAKGLIDPVQIRLPDNGRN